MQIRITRLLGTLLCLMTMAVWAGSASATVVCCDGISGFDPIDWTLMTAGDGSVDLSLVPDSVELTGSDTGSVAAINTDYTTIAVGNGTVSFDWDYLTSDSGGPSFDPFGYLLNGIFTQLTNDGGADAQSGSVSFAVLAGNVFGFRIHTVDNQFGSASAMIDNFCAPIPEPSAALLFGAGLGVSGLAVRRPRQGLLA